MGSLRSMIAVWFVLAGALAASSGSAEIYPQRPVRIIAGNPGATADILARQVGRRLTERWGQQIVVDNRGGAAATIAAEAAMRALPDGYTLLMGQLNSHAIVVSLRKVAPYDPLKDFAPITRVASAPQVLVVAHSLPAADWKQFAEHLKARPGTLNYASAGTGTASHLTTELLKQRTGLNIVHVNYKGGAAASLAIMAGEVSTGFVPLATAWPALQSGKVKALGISSIKRFPTLPDTPTLHESGLPGFEAASWFGMFAPSMTPALLIDRLSREISDILHSHSTQLDLLKLGAESAPLSPGQFTAFVASEIGKWRDVIRLAGIAPQ